MLFATAGQARIFLVTVALGALLGLTHDGVRLLMALFKAKAVRYGLEGLFFCGAALAAFGAVYRCNGGDLQAYTVLGMGVGWCLYLLSLSKALEWICLRLGRRLGKLAQSRALRSLFR